MQGGAAAFKRQQPAGSCLRVQHQGTAAVRVRLQDAAAGWWSPSSLLVTSSSSRPSRIKHYHVCRKTHVHKTGVLITLACQWLMKHAVRDMSHMAFAHGVLPSVADDCVSFSLLHSVPYAAACSWTRSLLVSLPESVEGWREQHQLAGNWSRLLR